LVASLGSNSQVLSSSANSDRDLADRARERTRHLIELGGLVVKAGVVDLTGNGRAMIYGALLWMPTSSRANKANRRERCGSQRGSKRSRRTHSKMHDDAKLKMLVADLLVKLYAAR
jgi:hypothetical protein